ncbi:carboxymuconolactone decarboxylase family protein [Methylibium sp.]|uniref:carboxymuconolactone decarboxylase family protein n=1 Tax=Methylibium sp. TaxID=2067992 RepID=UPI003D0C3756
MSRIASLSADQTPADSRPLLDAVNRQLGMVPNLMKVVGHSPAALEGYLSLSGALAKGSLGAGLQERIALAVAEVNQCDYCLAAHTYLGSNVAKLSDAEIQAARDGDAADPKVAAAVGFAQLVASSRGRVSDAELASLRAAGFGDAETVEIVVNVALNVLTNYINNVARTDIDFPQVSRRAA